MEFLLEYEEILSGLDTSESPSNEEDSGTLAALYEVRSSEKLQKSLKGIEYSRGIETLKGILSTLKKEDKIHEFQFCGGKVVRAMLCSYDSNFFPGQVLIFWEEDDDEWTAARHPMMDGVASIISTCL